MTSELDSVHIDEQEKKVVIDPRKVCEELGFRIIDPTSFTAVKDLAQENDWHLFETMDADTSAGICEAEGMVVLDLAKDPDPFGNHGISILNRLAAMGWPADQVLIVEPRESVLPEDLL
jgi:hypothetical protein